MDMSVLKSRVSGRVHFIYAVDFALWYECGDGWRFPVPFADTGNEQGGGATFLAADKAILFMRWIRKHMLAEDHIAEDT